MHPRGLAAAAAALVLLVGACDVARMVRRPGTACGAYDEPNRVLAEVTLERLADLRSRIPRLGVAPVRGDPDYAALLVVFVGPGRDTEIRAGSASAGAIVERGGAGLANLCVVAADGSTTLIPNVDLAGFVP